MADELRPLPSVSASRPVNPMGKATGTQLQEGQTTRAQASAKSAPLESAYSPAAEVFGAPVPTEITIDPINMQTEWGWRRFLTEMILNEQSVLQAGDQPALVQKMTQILWKALSPLLQEYIVQGEEVFTAGWMTPDTLLPFSGLQVAHFHDPNVPEKVKRFAMAEKLRLSVRSQGQSIVGGGLFYPPVVKGQDYHRAVYWQAERQTMLGAEGKLTQHLFLSTEVNGKSLELLLIFARPTLAVHIRTEDEHLRRGLEDSRNLASVSLQALGWEVSQFSVGTLSETEGEC